MSGSRRPRPSQPAPGAEAEISRLQQENETLRAALELRSAVAELPDAFEVLLGSVLGDCLAVPLTHVVEVVPRVLLAPLPDAPPQVAGYMRWRGQQAPVVDMGTLCTGTPLPVRVEDRIAVIRLGGSELRGLLLSEVEGVIRVQKAELAPLRPGAAGAAWALAFLRVEERPYLLVSLDELLRPLTGLAIDQPQVGAL